MLESSTETNNTSLCSHNAINLQCVSPGGTKRYIMNKGSTYWSGSMVQGIGPYGWWCFLTLVDFVPRSIKYHTPFWMTSPRSFSELLIARETRKKTWWRHQMETFSALLALCVGNSPVTGEFPSQRPVTRSFGIFFLNLRVNKRLSKQPWGWWFETPLRSLWRHCNCVQFFI